MWDVVSGETIKLRMKLQKLATNFIKIFEHLEIQTAISSMKNIEP